VATARVAQSKQEQRLKQWQEEQAGLKARDGDTALSTAEKLRAAQQKTATPFVVLSGSIHAAQVTDASSRYATADRDAPQPAAPAAARGARSPLPFDDGGAGGGALRPGGAALPPLEGAEKVRFMLGIPGGKRAAGGPPGAPPAKRQREG
jgi:U4/U6.U5 tri-snRNP-associated protein 1